MGVGLGGLFFNCACDHTKFIYRANENNYAHIMKNHIILYIIINI